MHGRRLAWGLSILMALAVPAAVSGQAAPEVRAMWVTRFEWPSGSEATIKDRIDTICQDLVDHHFNTVFWQVRGQADVLYPSPYEVWSPLINGGVDPGWDPLAYAIQAAHARGLKFHAYINTFTCWNKGSGAMPANPNHLFYAHANAADPLHRDWLIHDSAGQPMQYSGSYMWLAPGIPAYQAYLRQQVLYIVQNYDVDGIHFDYIRTCCANVSYDAISEARRANPLSNPNALDFDHWTSDQIVRMVCDDYAAVSAIKSQVIFSCAVFANCDTAPFNVHQDAVAFARAGGMDMLVPMMYSSGGTGSAWDTQLQTWLARRGDRLVVAGHDTGEGTSMLLEQIELTRTRGGQGNSLFSWGTFVSWADYLSGVYQQPAVTPEMPWKTNPSTGIIYGYVTNAAGQTVVDAQVKRSGSDYVGLSSGDGIYSFLLVEPGTYTLQARHPAFGGVSRSNITVSAGQVVRCDLPMGALLPPVLAEVAPDPEEVSPVVEYRRYVTLAQGSADAWTLIDGPPGATIDSFGQIRGWTPTLRMAGKLFSFTVRATNALGSDDETWQVQVIPLPDCTIHKLTGFEERPNGSAVLFRLPRYSGTTSDNLMLTPNVAEVTDEVPAFKGSKVLRVQWQFVDTSQQRWFRLTTSGGAVYPNPTVVVDRRIRLRLRLDSGRLRVALGIRETDVDVPVGANGGTTGTIEWLGATSRNGSAPQGTIITGMPGVWQTIDFDPRTSPVYSYTGDGHLYTPTGKGTFEEIGISLVDTAGPFTLYLDDIDFGCYSEPFGDFDADGYVDATDWNIWSACDSGPVLPFMPGCAPCDFDEDGDVDALDFAAWQRCYSGVLPQVDPYCGD